MRSVDQVFELYNITWGLVKTLCQLLIKWLLRRGYFCSLGRTSVAVTIVVRWQLQGG